LLEIKTKPITNAELFLSCFQRQKIIRGRHLVTKIRLFFVFNGRTFVCLDVLSHTLSLSLSLPPPLSPSLFLSLSRTQAHTKTHSVSLAFFFKQSLMLGLKHKEGQKQLQLFYFYLQTLIVKIVANSFMHDTRIC